MNTYSFKNIYSNLYVKTGRKVNWNFLCLFSPNVLIANINLNVIHFHLFLESLNKKKIIFQISLKMYAT